MSAAQPPVFVDDTGRRRILTRRAGRAVTIGFTAYLGFLALGFARDPQVGPIHLPTFGLPGLGLMIPPAPTVLGEEATRTISEAPFADPGHGLESPAGPEAAPPAGGGTIPGTTRPAQVDSRGATPRPTAPAQATTSSTTVPAPGTSSTSTTTPQAATTPSTTSTTRTLPGQGQGIGPGQDQEKGIGQGQAQGQGAGSETATGPDGSGAPGQLRKTNTTTGG